MTDFMLGTQRDDYQHYAEMIVTLQSTEAAVKTTFPLINVDF